MDWTAIGTVITMLGGVWAIVTYKTDALERRIDKHEEKMEHRMNIHEEKMEHRMNIHEEKMEHRMNIQEEKIFSMLVAQDEKIFQLATGKTLREAMMEAKKTKEKQETNND